MPLSELQMSEAKEEAISFLESSIYALALMLSLNPEELVAPYDVPVLQENINHPFYVSLKHQLEALAKIAP